MIKPAPKWSSWPLPKNLLSPSTPPIPYLWHFFFIASVSSFLLVSDSSIVYNVSVFSFSAASASVLDFFAPYDLENILFISTLTYFSPALFSFLDYQFLYYYSKSKTHTTWVLSHHPSYNLHLLYCFSTLDFVYIKLTVITIYLFLLVVICLL